MSLKDFLKKLSSEAEGGSKDVLVDFAARCQTSVGQLRNIAGGSRRAGENLCINIERESGGEVRCEDLRPDVDWGYIRGTEPQSRAA